MFSTNVDQLKNEAYQHYQAGDPLSAARLCQQVLKYAPHNVEAIYLMGVLAKDDGNLERADELFSRTASLAPSNHVFVNALGEVRLARGKEDDALTCFQRAAAAAPSYARAHNNVGRVLHSRGDLKGAEASFSAAVNADPRYAIALNNLGAIKQTQNDHKTAIACFKQALNVQPNYPEAHFNLGLSVQALGDPQGGMDCFRKAIALRPTYARAYFRLGQALAQFRRDEEALHCIKIASEYMTDDAEVHRRLADLQMLKGDWPTAQATLERTVKLRPDDPDLFARLVYLRQMICEWRYYDADSDRLWADAQKRIGTEEATGVVPFQTLTLPWSKDRLLAIAKSHSDTIDFQQRKIGFETPLTVGGAADGRIRIGYLSGDYYDHPIAHLVQGLFGRHDRNRFEVFNYSFSPPDNSPYRQRIMTESEHFVDVAALSNPALAKRIADDGVTILVDLMGHTGVNRVGVFALRAAPIQVSYLGMLGTMGASYFDYAVTDRIVTTPEDAPWYREKIVTLPNSYLIVEPESELPDSPVKRSDFGLPEQGMVFCTFNNTYKIEPRSFGIWMNILKATPGSVLWLYSTSKLCEANLRRETESRGVAPERLIFASFVPRPDHIRRHRAADLFLDTLVYNAAATASLALQAGLPVLTCRGDTFASRVGASLLTTFGLPEMIASDPDDYQARAIELSNRPDELSRLRGLLVEKRATSPLFDTQRLVRNLERAYQGMWNRFRSGQPPAAMDIVETDP